MVARIKDLGRIELGTLRTRVLRVAALGRINKGDADNIVEMIDKLDAYIIRMEEYPDKESSLW